MPPSSVRDEQLACGALTCRIPQEELGRTMTVRTAGSSDSVWVMRHVLGERRTDLRQRGPRAVRMGGPLRGYRKSQWQLKEPEIVNASAAGTMPVGTSNEA
jgi:hypothetical protein